MSGWPRSLFGRNAVLLVALLVVAQIVSLALVRELIVKPRYQLFSESLARTVSAVRAGLTALPPAQRGAFVDQFNQRAVAKLPPAAERSRTARQSLTPLERNFVRSVSERVAAEGGEIVWRREAGGSLSVRLALDNEDYWIMLPGVLPAREFSGAWLAASLSCVALALVGALLIQRRLHRPLAGVVRAARTLAAGETPPRLAEDGPAEVATLAASFNHMAASLAQAERERTLMLAGISHDLRTPLTKLRLGVEILREQSEPALVASMTRSVDEMDAIVGQFLDFARDDYAASAEPGDVQALAREIASACADHGQVLTLALEPTPPVRLHREALRRAIVNLIENAYRHGRLPVTLRTGRLMDWARVDVEDCGDGIPSEELEAMKQPFRRAGDARHGAPGSGLGLAIVERIARRHGGRLELSRAEGGGLRASVLLPPA
jgi:two-component system, OmpR family, osmolarity sensor histidine kinase EnvZ